METLAYLSHLRPQHLALQQQCQLSKPLTSCLKARNNVTNAINRRVDNTVTPLKAATTLVRLGAIHRLDQTATELATIKDKKTTNQHRSFYTHVRYQQHL